MKLHVGVQVKLAENIVDIRKSLGLPVVDFAGSLNKVLTVKHYDSNHKVVDNELNKNAYEDLYRIEGGKIVITDYQGTPKEESRELSIAEVLIPRSALIVV